MRATRSCLFLVLGLLVGCSMYSSNPLSSGYHNTTAHFNAYFIANEQMMEIEREIYARYQWNYNKVLPIYPPVDSTDAKSLEAQIKECIEKASIAIQRHEGSKWEDDSYVLVGKARYYALEYPDAIETFKFINKYGEDDDARHEALVQLIKTFVDAGEINNAIAVSDYLKKEKLNTRNQRELSLVRAYLYQKREDLDQMVKHLVEAEALMRRSSDIARIDFIIGQVYQQLGFEAEAYNYYSSTLKNSPVYELAFYTKLNMAQVTQLTSSGDVKKIRKYFRKLLRDTKNKEYQDKIYYELASFELKQGNLEEAIEFFELSARTSVKNNRQKAYAYLKLGQIYYDSLKNFELAKSYYDSTVAVMPKDEENYARISQRQEVLDDFVKQITTIRTNDSLIVLSQLPEDSVIARATRVVEEKMKQQEEQKKRQERREANLAANSLNQNEGELIGTSLAGATWYFNNPTALGRGSAEFKRIWGNRPLADNWRRSYQTGGLVTASAGKPADGQELAEEDPRLKMEEDIQQLLAAVPQTPEQIQKLLSEVEVALYNLGNIYNFNLEEKENAIQTFESHRVRFPDTENTPEVLYQLFLLYKQSGDPLSEERANELRQQYPESIFTKLLDNPKYREESQATTELLEKLYKQAYALYSQAAFAEAQYLLDSTLTIYPENPFSDNLALLRVLCVGKQEGQYKYQYELNNFIKTYPESDLVAYAQTLVQASEDYQINLYNSSRARFVEYFNQKHYLVVVYANKSELSQSLSKEVEGFIKEKNFKLTTGNLILSEEYALVLVNDFPAKGSAEKFLQLMQTDLPLNDLHKGEKIYSFVITEDNFDIFYQTKDVNAYLNFFEKHYLR